MTTEKEKEICSGKIHFGDIFEDLKDDQTTLRVILHLGKGDLFESSLLEKKNEKLIVNPQVGTTDISKIHRFTGERLTLEKVIEGLNNYLGKSLGESSPLVLLLTEESKKPSRLLK